MTAQVSEAGVIVCSEKHKMGAGPWSPVTQALLLEWVRTLGGSVRCDRCGKPLDRNTRRREERN